MVSVLYSSSLFMQTYLTPLQIKNTDCQLIFFFFFYKLTVLPTSVSAIKLTWVLVHWDLEGTFCTVHEFEPVQSYSSFHHTALAIFLHVVVGVLLLE